MLLGLAHHILVTQKINAEKLPYHVEVIAQRGIIPPRLGIILKDIGGVVRRRKGIAEVTEVSSSRGYCCNRWLG